jgi:hypothetical protein
MIPEGDVALLMVFSAGFGVVIGYAVCALKRQISDR